MRIRGLGVIGEAVLELGPGLTVVTGETGAGKTMVVTGLGLLLGARADAGAVRAGAASAAGRGRAAHRPGRLGGASAAREAGAVLDDDTLLVARTVTSEGRSRAHLGGRSVPVGLLAELAPELVAVHGQADQIRLQTPARQRELLDRYAGEPVADPLAAYVECFEQLRQVQARLDDVRHPRPGAAGRGRPAPARPGRGRGGRPAARGGRRAGHRAVPADPRRHAARGGRAGPCRAHRRHRRRRPDGRGRQRGRPAGRGRPGAGVRLRRWTRPWPSSRPGVAELGFLTTDIASRARVVRHGRRCRPEPDGGRAGAGGRAARR